MLFLPLSCIMKCCTSCPNPNIGSGRGEHDFKMSSLRSSSRARRFKPLAVAEAPSYADHINALGMIASLAGLLMQVSKFVPGAIYILYIYIYWREHVAIMKIGCWRVQLQMKWAVWIGVYCSVVYMTNSGVSEDKKQTFSLLM